jgi:hypothetical protein
LKHKGCIYTQDYSNTNSIKYKQNILYSSKFEHNAPGAIFIPISFGSSGMYVVAALNAYILCTASSFFFVSVIGLFVEGASDLEGTECPRILLPDI